MINNIVEFKEINKEDNFCIEYEVLPSFDPSILKDDRRKKIYDEISSIEKNQDILETRIQELNADIDRLTNHADGIDYTIAVACGILCSVIDSLFIGEFDFKEALDKSTDKINKYVKEKAEKVRTDETIQKAIASAKEKAAAKGLKLSDNDIKEIKEKVTKSIKETFRGFENGDSENGTVNSLRRAIIKLENYYKINSDNMFKGVKGMNTASHHLDDLAHHPTLLGFCAAIIGEFFKAGIFVDKNGKWRFIVGQWDEEQKKKLFNLVFSIIIAALLRWLLYSTTSKYKDEIDKNLPKPIAHLLANLSKAPLAIVVIKHCLNVFDNWWGHLSSDIAGSRSTPGEGMGISGLFVSILKEISSIPPLNLTSLPRIIDGIYTKKRFDMRSELALISELGKQAIPVLLGDIITRTIYFVRHLIKELKLKNCLTDVDWKNIVPFNNRTITRMLVIESGTFSACDIADAAIRSALKNGCNVYNPKLYTDFILRVNFVGVGRLAIAIGSDIKMGIDRENDVDEQIFIKNKILTLDNAIVSYKQENMWIAAKDTSKAMIHLQDVALHSTMFYFSEMKRIEDSVIELNEHINHIKQNDSEFTNELLDLIS